jgi:hypothetical protein
MHILQTLEGKGLIVMQPSNMREPLQSQTEELTMKIYQKMVGPPSDENEDMVEIPTVTLDNLRKRVLTDSRLTNHFTEPYQLP